MHFSLSNFSLPLNTISENNYYTDNNDISVYDIYESIWKVCDMSKRKRFKRMNLSEFRPVMEKGWTPVQISSENIPQFLQRLSQEKIHSIYASGTFSPQWTSLPSGYTTMSSGLHAGGMEVYRFAPDDPVELNKDGYAIFFVPSESFLLVADLEKDGDREHWIDDIPDRLKGIDSL